MRLELPPRRRAQISLTPLIDVVFILLVFFMLASNFTQLRAIEVITPAAASGLASGSEALLVRVYTDERVELNGRLLVLDELQGQVRQAAQGRAVLVQPMEEARLQTLVNVLERLAGIPNVSLVKP